MKEGRIINTDIARGLAILSVISWHTVNCHIAWVDSWAMPVFFVIMGMFFKPTQTWKEMISKKARTILLPFLLLSIPSYIQYGIQLSFRDFVMKVIDPFNCVHGVGWFLICMFWCYLIYYGVHRVTKGKTKYKILVSLTLSVAFFYLSTLRPSFLAGHRAVLPFFLSTSFTCLILVCFGDVMREVMLEDRVRSRKLLIASLLMGGGYNNAVWLQRWCYDCE